MATLHQIITRRTAIGFRGAYVTITPTTEMGGGVDGYYVQDSDGTVVASFDRPYCSTPEEEWRALSDLGKDLVRADGWSGIGDKRDAIAAALRELGVAPMSSELQEYLDESEARLEQYEADARAEVNDLFDLAKQHSKTSHFLELVEEYRRLGAIIAVAKELEVYSGGYKQAWASWPIPSTNH